MTESSQDPDLLRCFIGRLVSVPTGFTRTGPLAGLTLAIKDNIDVAGFATTAGSPALDTKPRTNSAPAVQRLIDAGAHVLAKANMHELAFGVTSRNATFGFVRNPADHSRSAGGSSGGSAAAVAAGFVDAALGTDTGGSVRVPASFCGVVGFRPSTLRYPPQGIVPLAASRDTVGPVARDIDTIIRMDACLSGDPAQDAGVPANMRLGVPDGFLTEDLHPAVSASWQQELERLARRGVALVPVSIAGLWELIDRASPVSTAYELARDFATCILSRSHVTRPQEFIQGIASDDVRVLFDMIILQGGAPPLEAYRQVMEHDLPKLRRLIDSIFTTHRLDAWIFPTVPVPATPLTEGAELDLNGTRRPLFRTVVRNLQQASLIGMPSISVPMTPPDGEPPAGLCIEALPGRDRWLLDIARRITES